MKYYLLIILCLGICPLQGQEPEERLLEGKDQAADYSEAAVPWAAYTHHPLNLNTAGIDELLLLPGVSMAMAEALVSHRIHYGPLLHLLELQTIPGWSIPVILELLQLVSVGNAGTVSLRQLMLEGKHQISLLYTCDFQQSKGYEGIDPPYQGKPFRTLLSYRYQASNRVYFGFTGEKDEGEPWLGTRASALFDFQSMHLLVKPNGIVKTLALGDFQATFGQGLVFGNMFSTGKSSWVLNTQQWQSGFRPYRSVNENEFLRGAAITLHTGRITCDLFLSQLYADANVTGDSTAGSFSSMISTGLHRTVTEIARKDQLLLRQQGAHLSYTAKKLVIGIIAVNHHFDHILQKELKPYQLFDLKGISQRNIGIHYRYTYRNMQLYGELAHSHGYALLQGFTASLSPMLDLSLVYRNYAPSYQTLYTSAFGENGSPRNEQGIYLGLSCKPNPRLSIAHYLDIYRSPWLKYLADAPSSGHDMLVEISYQPSRQMTLYGRCRQEISQKNNATGEPHYHYLVPVKHQQFRLHASYSHIPKLTLQTRAELSWYAKGNRISQGNLFFQDISWKPFDIPIALQGRFTWFSTPGYDSRIYAYENDLPFVYSVKAFMYSGTRYYLSFRYSYKKLLTCTVRYGHTRYINLDSYGSGNDLVNSPIRNDLGILLRLNL